MTYVRDVRGQGTCETWVTVLSCHLLGDFPSHISFWPEEAASAVSRAEMRRKNELRADGPN